MERRKAANNEIFDILLKSALITRYENEVSAAMLSADEHTYPAEFHRRLRQIKTQQAERSAYLRQAECSADWRSRQRRQWEYFSAVCSLAPRYLPQWGMYSEAFFLPMTATASRQAATLILTKISVSAMCLRDMN